jgi:hypothetical protein
MKNSIISCGFAALLISLIFIGSCSLLEHDVEAELKATFNVNETQTGTNLPYDDQRTIKATDDEDIAKDLSKIKDWNVRQVFYRISNYQSGAQATFTGSIIVNPPNKPNENVKASVSNIDLQALSNAGTKVKLNVSGTDLGKIASWFDEYEAVQVTCQGTLSEAPVYFVTTIYVDLVVKVKLL